MRQGPEIPKDLAEWKEQAANAAIFRHMEEGGGNAERLLEISPTNRIITVESGRCLMVLRLAEKSLGPRYEWLGWMCNRFEEYQLTVGVPKNSRDSFLAGLTAMYQGMRNAAQGMFGRMFGGDGGAGA